MHSNSPAQSNIEETQLPMSSEAAALTSPSLHPEQELSGYSEKPSWAHWPMAVYVSCCCFVVCMNQNVADLQQQGKYWITFRTASTFSTFARRDMRAGHRPLTTQTKACDVALSYQCHSFCWEKGLYVMHRRRCTLWRRGHTSPWISVMNLHHWCLEPMVLNMIQHLCHL